MTKILYDGWALVYQPNSPATLHTLTLLAAHPPDIPAWIGLLGETFHLLPEVIQQIQRPVPGTDWGRLRWEQRALPALAIQADGRIVAAGYTSGTWGSYFALVRYNSDGSLDATFDGDGMVTTDFGSNTHQANGVAVQADGKIVAAGRIFNLSRRDYDFAVAATPATVPSISALMARARSPRRARGVSLRLGEGRGRQDEHQREGRHRHDGVRPGD